MLLKQAWKLVHLRMLRSWILRVPLRMEISSRQGQGKAGEVLFQLSKKVLGTKKKKNVPLTLPTTPHPFPTGGVCSVRGTEVLMALKRAFAEISKGQDGKEAVGRGWMVWNLCKLFHSLACPEFVLFLHGSSSNTQGLCSL